MTFGLAKARLTTIIIILCLDFRYMS